MVKTVFVYGDKVVLFPGEEKLEKQVIESLRRMGVKVETVHIPCG